MIVFLLATYEEASQHMKSIRGSGTAAEKEVEKDKKTIIGQRSENRRTRQPRKLSVGTVAFDSDLDRQLANASNLPQFETSSNLKSRALESNNRK